MPTFEGRHLLRAIDNDADDLELQAIWRSWVEMVDEFIAEKRGELTVRDAQAHLNMFGPPLPVRHRKEIEGWRELELAWWKELTPTQAETALVDRMPESMTRKERREWLETQQLELDGKAPAWLLAEGRIEEVLAMAHGLGADV